jgi:hypothetical protein
MKILRTIRARYLLQSSSALPLSDRPNSRLERVAMSAQLLQSQALANHSRA